MENIELKILEAQDCRFCNIPTINGKPTKGPQIAGWQSRPLTADQIPQGNNIGLLTGELSGGILAVDFDGPWTWTAWMEHVGVPFEQIDTITWSSGRAGRAQMAFRVPGYLWPYMSNKKQISGPMGDDGQTQQLEFRWNGCQSVLPPSMHPDLNKQYQWLRSPSDCLIMEAPAELLECIIKLTHQQSEVHNIEPVNVDNLTEDDVENVNRLLTALRAKMPMLQYEDWIRVTWAVCKKLGTGAGVMVMRDFYPESKSGEYNTLLRNYNPARSPGLGTVAMLAGIQRTNTTESFTFDLRQLNKDIKDMMIL